MPSDCGHNVASAAIYARCDGESAGVGGGCWSDDDGRLDKDRGGARCSVWGGAGVDGGAADRRRSWLAEERRGKVARSMGTSTAYQVRRAVMSAAVARWYKMKSVIFPVVWLDTYVGDGITRPR